MSKSRFFATLALVLAVVVGLQAQLSLPHTTFSPKQTISSSQFTTNFTQISNNALNRTGGTMTGNLLFSADATHDIGASGATRPRDIFVGDDVVVADDVTIGDALAVTGASTFASVTGTTGSFSSTLAVTGAVTFTSTLAVDSTGAAAIDVAGGITAGSGNVAIVGTDGRIPAISSTQFASLSGANLTGLLEANIADGSVFPRLSANETISGSYTFSGTTTTYSSGLPTVIFNETDAGADGKNWVFAVNAGSFQLATATDAAPGTNVVNVFRTVRSGTAITDFELPGPLRLSGTISPSALSASQNDYAPAGFASAFLVRLTAATGGSTITSLAGGVAGRMVMLCSVSGVTGDDIVFPSESGSGTAANRFANNTTLSGEKKGCVLALYDGTSSRWRFAVAGS